jgi:hypothetical protein
MRQRLIRHGILIVAAVAAAAAWSLAVPWASSARADAAQVTIIDAAGGQRTLSLAALAGGGDVIERTYTLRSSEGEASQTVSGFSPAAILDAAGVDPYGFSYLELQRPAGGSVLLSRHQALDPAAFAEGPPVVYATPTGTGFLRPNGGPGDLNATDSFEAPQGITVLLRNGSPLQVRARASTLRTRPGRPVTFNAIVDRSGAGEQLAYSWYFDDGSSSTGPRTRHRFAKRGSYDVVLGMTTPGDEAGASAVVTIQVGPPLGGPDRKGGGRSRDPEAPDHGAATGGHGPRPSSVDSRSGATADTKVTGQAKPELGREREPQPRPASGPRVGGLLLSSTTATPDPPSSVAARTGRLDAGGSGSSIPGAALGLLATAALLGLGALSEARSLFR